MAVTASILADLFILFVAAKSAGIVFRWLRQPAVIGELLVGVAIGPHALGWVGTADTALLGLFHGDPEAANEAVSLTLEVVAELGVIVLLFVVGLETRLSTLLVVGRRAVAVGLLGIVAPFFGGYLFMHFSGAGEVEALFVGVALVATSVGITARVLRDLGALGSREARIVLGAAVIDDILAMILLAVVNQLGVRAEVSALAVALVVAQAVGLTLFVALIGSRAVGRFHLHLGRIPIEHAPLMLSLTLMLGLAALANLIGLAAIIGAFLAGMVLAEAAEHYALERATRPIYQFLVPFFFVIVGTRVDVGGFLSVETLGTALAVTAIAIAAKFLGAGLGGIGMGPRSMAIIGTGMVPRGEVGLIVANLGMLLGAVSPELFSVVVFMSVVTTVVAPPLLALLCRARPPGCSLPSQEPE